MTRHVKHRPSVAAASAAASAATTGPTNPALSTTGQDPPPATRDPVPAYSPVHPAPQASPSAVQSSPRTQNQSAALASAANQGGNAAAGRGATKHAGPSEETAKTTGGTSRGAKAPSVAAGETSEDDDELDVLRDMGEIETGVEDDVRDVACAALELESISGFDFNATPLSLKSLARNLDAAFQVVEGNRTVVQDRMNLMMRIVVDQQRQLKEQQREIADLRDVQRRGSVRKVKQVKHTGVNAMNKGDADVARALVKWLLKRLGGQTFADYKSRGFPKAADGSFLSYQSPEWPRKQAVPPMDLGDQDLLFNLEKDVPSDCLHNGETAQRLWQIIKTAPESLRFEDLPTGVKLASIPPYSRNVDSYGTILKQALKYLCTERHGAVATHSLGPWLDQRRVLVAQIQDGQATDDQVANARQELKAGDDAWNEACDKVLSGQLRSKHTTYHDGVLVRRAKHLEYKRQEYEAYEGWYCQPKHTGWKKDGSNPVWRLCNWRYLFNEEFWNTRNQILAIRIKGKEAQGYPEESADWDMPGMYPYTLTSHHLEQALQEWMLNKGPDSWWATASEADRKRLVVPTAERLTFAQVMETDWYQDHDLRVKHSDSGLQEDGLDAEEVQEGKRQRVDSAEATDKEGPDQTRPAKRVRHKSAPRSESSTHSGTMHLGTPAAQATDGSSNSAAMQYAPTSSPSLSLGAMGAPFSARSSIRPLMLAPDQHPSSPLSRDGDTPSRPSSAHSSGSHAPLHRPSSMSRHPSLTPLSHRGSNHSASGGSPAGMGGILSHTQSPVPQQGYSQQQSLPLYHPPPQQFQQQQFQQQQFQQQQYQQQQYQQQYAGSQAAQLSQGGQAQASASLSGPYVGENWNGEAIPKSFSSNDERMESTHLLPQGLNMLESLTPDDHMAAAVAAHAAAASVQSFQTESQASVVFEGNPHLNTDMMGRDESQSSQEAQRRY